MARAFIEYHPVIGHRFVPGVRSRVPSETGGFVVQANALGFRSDREYNLPLRQGVRRVLVFGDSFTAGDGVANGQRYTEVLEGSLENVEVFNFGLPGTGTDQQYLAYREYAVNMPCHLLVLAPLVENIRRVASRYRMYSTPEGPNRYFMKPYFELDDTGSLVLRNVPPRPDPLADDELPATEFGTVNRGGRFPALRHLATRLGLRDALLRFTGYQPLPEYGNPNDAGWRTMRAILIRWIREHQAAHGPVLLAPIPLFHYVEGLSRPLYLERFCEVATATGCAFHDVLPDLTRGTKAQRRAYRFKTDVHLTPFGHQALAKSLRPAIGHAMASA